MKNFIKTFESFTNETFYMPDAWHMEQEDMYRNIERERDERERDVRKNNDPSFMSSQKPTIYSDIMQAVMSYNSTMLSDIVNVLEKCIAGDMDPEKVDIPEQCRGLSLSDAKSLISMVEKIKEKKEEYQKDMEDAIDDIKEMSV
jgi:hypothetical protein